MAGGAVLVVLLLAAAVAFSLGRITGALSNDKHRLGTLGLDLVPAPVAAVAPIVVLLRLLVLPPLLPLARLLLLVLFFLPAPRDGRRRTAEPEAEMLLRLLLLSGRDVPKEGRRLPLKLALRGTDSGKLS